MGRFARSPGWSCGLTRRAVAASVLLAAILGGAFASLVLAINGLRLSGDLARHSRETLAAVDRVERLVIDLETGQRGFIITGEERFLEPWRQARADLPKHTAALERLSAEGRPSQSGQVRELTRATESYLRDYSVPAVNMAREDLASVRTSAVTGEGKQRVDALRAQFARFANDERAILSARQDRAAADARRAIIAATAGLAGSVLLITVSGGYLTRSIIFPVRRASVMARRVADGHLEVRMPESGPCEIGKLEAAFNDMTRSLASSREELRRYAAEQAALRRVATLVARRAPPAELFDAVADKVGRALGATCTAINRYEADGSATVVGAWTSDPGLVLPVGSQWQHDEAEFCAQVLRTGRPARMGVGHAGDGTISGWAREHAITAAVASPVEAFGHVWGVMIAFSAEADSTVDIAEGRLLDFTELVATAIADAHSRAELAASRARVVAAGDETRRRIERGLHDGAQQRLVSVALQLRAAEADVPAGQAGLKERLSQAAAGLADAVQELQEISRGLHPAILSRVGLGPALSALARRSAVPVELNADVGQRLPERVEVAAYYVVSEALANAAKHAHASVVHVDAAMEGGLLRLSIRDDGVGGADPGRGSGLIGLRDRIESLGGDIVVASPPGYGTSLAVTVPTTAEGASGA